MLLIEALITTEYSHVRGLICQQFAVGESCVVCQWEAEPPASIYEIVFITNEGTEIFKKNVNTNFAEDELNAFVGDTISVSVKNSFAQFKLIGRSMNRLLYEIRD